MTRRSWSSRFSVSSLEFTLQRVFVGVHAFSVSSLEFTLQRARTAKPSAKQDTLKRELQRRAHPDTGAVRNPCHRHPAADIVTRRTKHCSSTETGARVMTEKCQIAVGGRCGIQPRSPVSPKPMFPSRRDGATWGRPAGCGRGKGPTRGRRDAGGFAADAVAPENCRRPGCGTRS